MAIGNKDPIDFLQPILAAVSGEKLDKKLTSFVANQGAYWYYLAPIEGPVLALTTNRTGEILVSESTDCTHAVDRSHAKNGTSALQFSTVSGTSSANTHILNTLTPVAFQVQSTDRRL